MTTGGGSDGVDGEAAGPAELLATALATDGGRPLTERICAACVRLLPVSGAAISVLAGLGRLEFVCASDDVAARCEDLQFTAGVGPCVDAAVGGTPVLVANLADARDSVGARWPGFTGPAAAGGVRALYAFPLRLGALTLGVLALYRDTPGALTPGEVRQALLVADAAALALLDLRSAVSEPLVDGMPSAAIDDATLFGRPEVHQATGMVMAQLGVGAEEALVRLRAYAFAHDGDIGAVARDIVGLRLRLDGHNR